MSLPHLLDLLVWFCVVALVFYIFRRVFKAGKGFYWICSALVVCVLGWALAPDCMCTDVVDRLTGSLLVAGVVSIFAAMLTAFILKLKSNVPSRKI